MSHSSIGLALDGGEQGDLRQLRADIVERWEEAVADHQPWHDVLAMLESAVRSSLNSGSIPTGGRAFIAEGRRLMREECTKQTVKNMREMFVRVGFPALPFLGDGD